MDLITGLCGLFHEYGVAASYASMELCMLFMASSPVCCMDASLFLHVSTLSSLHPSTF